MMVMMTTAYIKYIYVVLTILKMWLNQIQPIVLYTKIINIFQLLETLKYYPFLALPKYQFVTSYINDILVLKTQCGENI